MSKLVQIIETSSRSRQVCLSVFFLFSSLFITRNSYGILIKQIDSTLPWVCSVIDRRRRQNMVKTSVTHIWTSSVIYYWWYRRTATLNLCVKFQFLFFGQGPTLTETINETLELRHSISRSLYLTTSRRIWILLKPHTFLHESALRPHEISESDHRNHRSPERLKTPYAFTLVC